MAGSFVMTREEREAFLADVHVGIIAIAEDGRAPLAVPVWYSYEPGGDVVVLMSGDSRKMTGIEAAGRYSLCAQTETAPYKYVTAEGPVTDVSVYGDAEIRTMAKRYLGDKHGDAYADASTAGDGGGVAVRMTPEHWLSTDYAKRG